MPLLRPRSLDQLLEALQRLPGVGKRSAERIAQHVITGSEDDVKSLAAALLAVRALLHPCETCGHLTETQPCEICTDAERDGRNLCVVGSERELHAIAAAGVFNGRYHILGGLISPLKGIGPDRLRLASLQARVIRDGVTELILALPPTTEGETTAWYIKEGLPAGVKVSRLGIGVPLGADLDYLDAGTLERALQGRQAF